MEEKGLLILAANSYFCVRAKSFQEAKITSCFFLTKDQLISKAWDHFLWKIRFSKKMNERRLTLLGNNSSSQKKANSFVPFFGESTAWQFAFEINWPLVSQQIW